jgi:hypothetical protein
MRKTKNGVVNLNLLILAICSLGALPAGAYLGQPSESVAEDVRRLAGAVVRSSQGTFGKTIESRVGESTIRHYIDASSVIFAVAWTGADSAERDALLGPYSQLARDYENAHPLHRPYAPYRKIEAAGAAIEFWKTRKLVKTRAYITSKVPQGMDLDLID